MKPHVYRALRNLREPRRVYCVMSMKGGVGKTTTSTLLSITTSTLGYKTGLLDLDLVNPSTHLVLGIDPREVVYVEEHGINPFIHGDIYYFSVVAYTRDKPIALRGDSVEDALWEILSIVNWGKLDALYIDTPPGMGDEHLDIVYRLSDIVKPIVITTPSILSVNSTRKTIEILKSIGYRDIYLLENMSNGPQGESLRKLDIIYLGKIPYISNFDRYIGDLDKLRELVTSIRLDEIARKLLSTPI